MSKISTFIVVIIALFCAVSAKAEIVDQVLASVDVEVILLSDVLMEIGPEMGAIRDQARNAQEFQALMDARIRETLTQSIDSHVLLREALLAGLTIDDAEVERRIEKFKDSYPSIEDYINDLERAGVTETEMRERFLKQQMARSMGAIKMQEYREAVVVSESEVAQYYYDHAEEFSEQERARCRQIFMPKSADDQENAISRARLNELIAELEAGAEFADLAIRYSKGPAATDGGAMGWIVRSGPDVEGDLIPTLETAVFELKAGEFTEVIETDGGFHILQVDEYLESGDATLDEVRKEIGPRLREEAAALRFEKWLGELRKRSRVQIFF
jgi:parvulin-like peptidyl-prolyl isomerase